jgi:predicted ATPase/DNA-binding winged helix-turn-helix (wHTH) protein
MTMLQFGDFEMDILSRSLKRCGREVRLGSRAFDLLAAMASRSGEVLSKTELMEAAWPETHVEESSLRVNIVALRRALDDGTPSKMIENVAGRGYTFTAPVQKLGGQRYQPTVMKTDPLPHAYGRLIGRNQLVDRWASETDFGISTIVGQGGIGKTRVALQIAKQIQDAYDAVYYVDISDSTHGPLSPLSTALKAGELTPDIIQKAVDCLIGKTVLIVLDGCESSIDRAAVVAEAIAYRNPTVAILATSREPLGIMGENVLHLSGLTIPSDDQHVPDITSFSGIELFADRVSLVAEEFAIESTRGLELAAEIVRKTGGNPLAIELAASRVADLGLENLVSSLDSPLRALRRGNRTSHPRQQTLRANLDWSFDLLDGTMQTVFARLSVFEGEFTRDMALELTGCEIAPDEFGEAIDRLVVKSLLFGQLNSGTYALPRLVREYAKEKLGSSAISGAGFEVASGASVRREKGYQHPINAAIVPSRTSQAVFTPVVRAA